MMAGLKVTPYEANQEIDQEIAPGITSVFTPGHTPGHMSYVIASGAKKILVQTDVANIPSMFVNHPDWYCIFDNEPELAKTTRHNVYDMAAAEKMTVVGYHFPYPCVGHIEKDGTGYRWCRWPGVRTADLFASRIGRPPVSAAFFFACWPGRGRGASIAAWPKPHSSPPCPRARQKCSTPARAAASASRSAR